jgi:predicted RNase H-like HicB family nuclease
MDIYIFPAIFDPCEEGGYCVTFPDLPGIVTEANSLEKAFSMAREALKLHLFGMEQDNDYIPQSTLPNKILTPPDAFVSLVEVWMPPVREEMLSRSVKKTLTIPKWLHDVAEQEQVDYTQLFQASLKKFLGVNEPQ